MGVQLVHVQTDRLAVKRCVFAPHAACRIPQAKYHFSAFPSYLHHSPIIRHALAGVLISHISHLGAVVTLYGLVRHIVPSGRDKNRQIAFTTACLHTISPAGLFLSASYGESTFAFTTFIGIYCYVRARKSLSQQSLPPAVSWTLLSGLSIALSTLLRSNGLLNGTIFLFDALNTTQHILTTRSAARILHLLSTILAGILLALAFALPQAVAYFEFCSPTPTRPWCTHFPPSIYTWVQKHYWHVGFLSYWTLNNAPLFLLAAPMLVVMIATGAAGLVSPRGIFSESSTISPASAHDKSQSKSDDSTTDLTAHLLPRLAVPQLILSLMALTSFHVQIVNRISSGYALWYIVLAAALNGSNQGGGGGVLGSIFGSRRRVEVLVRLMAMYAVVQGGLYAAFLPPA